MASAADEPTSAHRLDDRDLALPGPSQPAPTSNAASRVFAIYELLEQILLHLPLRSLLLSQRVNKTFFDVVKDSTPIRKALFLAPYGDLLTYDEHMWRTKSGEMARPVANPFVTSVSKDIDEHHEHYKKIGIAEPHFRRVPHQDLIGFSIDEHCKYLSNRSLEKMLLAQPAIDLIQPAVMEMREQRHIFAVRKTEEYLVDDNSGVTIRALVRPRRLLGAPNRWLRVPDNDLYQSPWTYPIQEQPAMKTLRMQETQSWVVVESSIDEISGFRMLEILEGT